MTSPSTPSPSTPNFQLPTPKMSKSQDVAADNRFGSWELDVESQSYCLSILAPILQTTSYGIVPIAAAISRASICCHDSVPCRPMITTSSPGETSSSPVTSTVIMSLETAPAT